MHPTFRGSCWPPHWPPPAALPSPPKSSSSKAGTPSNAPPGTTPRSVRGCCRWPGPRRWSVRTARSACSPKTTPGASAFPAQLARRRTAPAARLRPRPAGRQPVLRHPPALESPPVVQRTLGRAELRRLPLHRHQLPRQRTDRRRRRHPGQRPGDLRRSARRAAPHQRRRRQVRALRRQRPRQRGQPGQPRAAEGRPGQTRGADRHPAEHVRDRPATRPGAPRRHRPVTQPRGDQLRRPPSASEPDRRADQLPGTVAHVADGQAAIQRIRAQRQGPRSQRPGLRPRLPGRRHRCGPGRLRRRGQPSAVRPGGLYIEHPRGQPDPCRGPDPQAQGAGLAEPAVRRPGQRQAGPGQAPLRGELRGLPCEHRPRRPANPDQGPPGAPEGPWRRRADRHRPVDGLQHLHLQQPQRQLLRPVPTFPRHPSGVGIVGRTSKIADMQVPEVFQIMLGKKGQLADGIAEIIHAIVTGQQTLPGSDSLQAVPAGQLLLAGAALPTARRRASPPAKSPPTRVRARTTA